MIVAWVGLGAVTAPVALAIGRALRRRHHFAAFLILVVFLSGGLAMFNGLALLSIYRLV